MSRSCWRSRLFPVPALVLMAALSLAVACIDGDDGGGDVTLHLGTILPETGGPSRFC